MENNYKHIDLGYEFWQRDYMFRDGMMGEGEAHKLWISFYEAGTVRSVDEFFTWILNNRPEMIFNYQEEEERYRRENEPKIRKFFAEHLEGKSWYEVDDNLWDFYSDWHKDVFGYRPHGIVCGEYINPHARA